MSKCFLYLFHFRFLIRFDMLPSGQTSEITKLITKKGAYQSMTKGDQDIPLHISDIMTASTVRAPDPAS